MICTQCGHENIEGIDACDECLQPLTEAPEPELKSVIAHSVLYDHIDKLDHKVPVCVSPDMSIGDVLNLMVKNHTGCALIVKDEKLVGVFSERDALMKINTEVSSLRFQPVSEFMTEDPETLKVDDRIAFAIHKMDLGGYRHVPILDKDGSPKTIVSVRSIIKFVAQGLVETG